MYSSDIIGSLALFIPLRANSGESIHNLRLPDAPPRWPEGVGVPMGSCLVFKGIPSYVRSNRKTVVDGSIRSEGRKIVR